MRVSKFSPASWRRPEARTMVVSAITIGMMVLLNFSVTTAASAETLTRNQTAAVEASDQVLFCVERAEQPSETFALSKFQASRSKRSQASIVRTSGWATLPGKISPDKLLAAKCSFELRKLADEWRFPGAVQSAAFSQSPSVIHKMWRHDTAR